jgi:hypothetical protein
MDSTRPYQQKSPAIADGALRGTLRARLLAGRAHIHVDFHSDRHFDNFRCFPGHLALL